MAFKIFGRKKSPETAENYSFPIEERAETKVSESGSGAELLAAVLSGCRVTADTAMQVPAVARCVNMIAGAVAMLPVRMYRKGEDGKPQEINDDPRITLLNGDTGDTLTADAMRYAWAKDYLLNGGGYAYIERKMGMPTGLYYIAYSDVGVIKNTADPIYKKYNYSIRGKSFYPYQLLKILRNTDGYGKGRGIIDDSPLVIDTAYSMIKFQRSQMMKGGSKRGFLKTESRVDQKVIDEIKSKWRNLYSTEDSESVMFLNAGIDFKEISATSVEMQINQNIQTINSEILRLFGTSDGILSADTVKNAVMPVLDVMEAAFDNDLLLESEKGNVYFAFDTRELTRGDIQSRYAAYSVALQNNFMQLDEVRALEDLPPLGVNFIKLGLNDVLLDPVTNKIYTPNTNAMVDLGSGEGAVKAEPVDNSEKDDIIDVRGKYIQLPNGKMNGSLPSAKTELKAKIESGELPTKLDKDKQSRHVIGNPAYEKRIVNGEFPSYITVNKMKVQEIINSKSLTGKVQKLKDGQYQELITADEYFGVFCSLITHEKIKTNRGVIHYSKNGTHLVPTSPEE